MIAAAASTTEALTTTLEGEYAATYAYGLIGSHLKGAAALRALRALNAHRILRDQLRAQLSAAGQDPPPPAPAYQPPTPITSASSATTLAISVEQRLVRSWSALAASTTGDQRVSAARGASECAVRAVSWGAPSQAFPG